MIAMEEKTATTMKLTSFMILSLVKSLSTLILGGRPSITLIGTRRKTTILGTRRKTIILGNKRSITTLGNQALDNQFSSKPKTNFEKITNLSKNTKNT